MSLRDDPPSVWVLPSEVFEAYALKSGDNWRLPLPETRRGDSKTREEEFDEYCATLGAIAVGARNEAPTPGPVVTREPTVTTAIELRGDLGCRSPSLTPVALAIYG